MLGLCTNLYFWWRKVDSLRRYNYVQKNPMGGGKAMKYWRMIWIKSNIWQKFRHLPKVFWTIIFFRLGAKIFFNCLKASNIELWVVLEFYEGVFGFFIVQGFCLLSKVDQGLAHTPEKHNSEFCSWSWKVLSNFRISVALLRRTLGKWIWLA